MEGKTCSSNGASVESDGAQGNDAELDIAPGEFGRQQRATTDAKGRRQEQVTALSLVHAHPLHTVGDQVQLGEGAHKHEPGLTDYRQHQVTVVTDARTVRRISVGKMATGRLSSARVVACMPDADQRPAMATSRQNSAASQ